MSARVMTMLAIVAAAVYLLVFGARLSNDNRREAYSAGYAAAVDSMDHARPRISPTDEALLIMWRDADQLDIIRGGSKVAVIHPRRPR